MSSNAAARATYWRTYRAALVLFDAVALVLAGLFALAVRFPGDWLVAEAGTQVPYLTIIIAAVPLWLLIIAARRGYDPRILGLGSEEFRRVGNASLVFISLGALTAVAVDADPARRWVAIALPLAPLLAVTFRFAARKRLHAHRLAGAATHRVVVVGEGASQAALVDRLERSPWAGLRMVGTTRPQVDDDGRASLGHVPALVGQLGADTIAVAHSPHVTPTAMRELAWLLEGTGVGLLVAPALTDIAGPRIQVRPVSGLALLQIAEPEFGGARRLAKAAFDRLGALVLICLFSHYWWRPQSPSG